MIIFIYSQIIIDCLISSIFSIEVKERKLSLFHPYVLKFSFSGWQCRLCISTVNCVNILCTCITNKWKSVSKYNFFHSSRCYWIFKLAFYLSSITHFPNSRVFFWLNSNPVFPFLNCLHTYSSVIEKRLFTRHFMDWLKPTDMKRKKEDTVRTSL